MLLLRIREIAKENGVITMENKPLARALYKGQRSVIRFRLICSKLWRKYWHMYIRLKVKQNNNCESVEEVTS